MTVINYESRKALSAFRKYPAALAVYWVYLTRSNFEKRAWPTLRGLSEETGWGIDAVSDARAFLEQIEAIKRDPNYIRPSWRNKTPAELSRLANLDKTVYYIVTGYAIINGKRIEMLYMPPPEDPEIEYNDEDNDPMSDTVGYRPTPTEDIKDTSSTVSPPKEESNSSSFLSFKQEKQERKTIARRHKLPPRVRGINAIQEPLEPHGLEVVIARAAKAKSLTESQKRALNAPLMCASDGKIVYKPSLRQLWDDEQFQEYVQEVILQLTAKVQSTGSMYGPSRNAIIKQLLNWERWETWRKSRPETVVLNLKDESIYQIMQTQTEQNT